MDENPAQSLVPAAPICRPSAEGAPAPGAGPAPVRPGAPVRPASPASRAPSHASAFIRAENEDDDGYDPYSDRPSDPEPRFEADPWR